MKKIFRYIVAMSIFVWYLFPFYFLVLPEYAWSIIYYSIPVIYFMLRYKTVKIFLNLLYLYKKYFFIFLFLYAFSVLWAITVIIYNGSNDFNYIKYLLHILRIIFCYTFLLLFIYDFLHPKCLYKKFCLMYISACCFYVLVTSFMIFNPLIKTIWINLIYISPLDEKLSVVSHFITRFGLTGFSGFYHTYLCTIAVILLLYLLNTNQLKFSPIIFLTLLIGNFFYGRSGAICSILCIGMSIISFFNMQNLKKIFFLLSIAVCISYLIFISSDFIPEVALWLSWVLDPINQLIDSIGTGSISIGSSGDTMFQNMYFIPESDSTLLFGDGKYGDENSYYMNTDVGIMRALLFYGVIGEVLGYSSLCVLLSLLHVIYKKYEDKSGKLMVYMFTLQFLFFELKGDLYKFLFGIIFVAILASLYDFRDQGDRIKND